VNRLLPGKRVSKRTSKVSRLQTGKKTARRTTVLADQTEDLEETSAIDGKILLLMKN